MAHIEKKSAVSSTQRAIDRVSEAARPTALSMASSAHHMVDRLGGTANRVAHRLERTATRLKDAEQQLVGASCGYVRKHPLKSTGIALATGFLIVGLVGWYRAGRAEPAAEDDTPAADDRS